MQSFTQGACGVLSRVWLFVDCSPPGRCIFFFNHWATWEAPLGTYEDFKVSISKTLSLTYSVIKYSMPFYLPIYVLIRLCDTSDCSPPGSSAHGLFQARILKWVAISFSRGIFQTQESNLHFLCLLHCRRILCPLSHWGSPGEALGKPLTFHSEESVSCLVMSLCNPLDCSRPGSSVHGILQAYWSG